MISQKKLSVCQQLLERRSEERRTAFGSVELYREGAGSPVRAKLIDTSNHGFRVRVGVALVPGEQVRMCYPWGDVVARVVWCTERQEKIEAGLFVP